MICETSCSLFPTVICIFLKENWCSATLFGRKSRRCCNKAMVLLLTVLLILCISKTVQVPCWSWCLQTRGGSFPLPISCRKQSCFPWWLFLQDAWPPSLLSAVPFLRAPPQRMLLFPFRSSEAMQWNWADRCRQITLIFQHFWNIISFVWRTTFN